MTPCLYVCLQRTNPGVLTMSIPWLHSLVHLQNLGALFALMWGYIILAFLALWNAVRNLSK